MFLPYKASSIVRFNRVRVDLFLLKLD